MYSLIFLVVISFALSFFITPAVREVFLRLGIVDRPDGARKFHHRPIPRVGGVAIALSYVIAFTLLLATRLKAGLIIWGAFPLIWKLLPAAALVFVTGLLDDLVRLRPWQKLIGQVAAAVAAYFAGVQVSGVAGGHLMAWWLSFPATVIWLVACSNAVNLLDGIDGLAAGVGFVATTTMVIAAFFQHNVELAMATVPLAACLLAFLRYNFNPATIFLGDCGSLFIGFLLGCYGVLWSQKSATVLGMTAPLMALAIPLLDTAIAISRRFLHGQPILGADRGHIHHRLLDQGLTPRRAALLLYGVGTLAAILSLSMASGRFEVPVIIVFCVAVWVGIQRLGYVEFDTAGRLLLAGSFRKLLRSHISLRNFERALSCAQTPDECWAVLKNTYHEFGFYQIQMRLAGRLYRAERPTTESTRAWRVEIPLSAHDFIHLARQFNADSRDNTVAPFADSLRKILEQKIPDFSLPEPLPFEPLYQVASAAHR
jgi:UDP-GlcNAc:undecaprenyl-phosphate GlcNAc-1-phosphate transferase